MDERFRIRNYQALGANKKILFFGHCLRRDQAHVSDLPHYVIDIFKERAEKVAFVKGADEAEPRGREGTSLVLVTVFDTSPRGFVPRRRVPEEIF